MKIFKTAVLIEGNGIAPVGTIEHEGGLWLVPLWIATQDGERLMPARLIRLDVLPYKKVDNHPFADFQLLDPMPKGVLDGSASLKVMQSYVVKIDPTIQRPKETTAH